ncbi:MAG: HU family DNA-binding protein [Chloroflexi bacterium CFX4]|jgi:DNA-binding protein HU-beta|nr:HU family DNA-binding protein [Chloroflexi bacterium CFX4]MDL1921021.1 HU family DNA-binding protein [Chloroflexi bacterium CFX3]
MQKTELVKAIADKTGQSQKAVGEVVGALTDIITATLKSGDKVTLTGFGTFEVREKKARTGTNPSTREKIQIPAGKSVKFSVGATLKSEVTGKASAKKAAKKAPKKKK